MESNSKQSIRFTYVVPVHNEAQTLKYTMEKLYKQLKQFPSSRIFFVENGSVDSSIAILNELGKIYQNDGVFVFLESNTGIGYALHRGLLESIAMDAESQPQNHWIVLTAADLPFEFSDLFEFIKSQENNDESQIFIGSKAHAKSVIQNSLKRQVVSYVYRILRFLILGIRVRDSQGTFFIRADVAKCLVSKIRSRDFFYTTELVYYAERAGYSIRELPVHYTECNINRKSSVKVFRHGFKMFLQMLKLKFLTKNCH